jgi:hypothetical protein
MKNLFSEILEEEFYGEGFPKRQTTLSRRV